MDRDKKWTVIAGQRRGLADLLACIDDSDWERPSLCAEWRVKDVAAHLALTPRSPGLLRILVMGLRARGNFDSVNRDLAVAHADRPPADLVAELRGLADSRRKPAITTLDNLLFDTLVHVQDIAVPLGLTATMPLEAAREGAERVWRMGWPFWARRRLRGLRLCATDIHWTVGDGAEVRGPVGVLLLVLTGRTAAVLPQLSGPGAEQLAENMRRQRRLPQGRSSPRGTRPRPAAPSSSFPMRETARLSSEDVRQLIRRRRTGSRTESTNLDLVRRWSRQRRRGGQAARGGHENLWLRRRVGEREYRQG